MKRIAVLLITFGLCLSAQAVDKVLKVDSVKATETAEEVDLTDLSELLGANRVNPCIDYNYNATILMPELYERQQFDSIRVVLDFLERECDWLTNSSRSRSLTRMLLDIRQGQFEDSDVGPSIIDQLITYREGMEHVMAWGYGNWEAEDWRSVRRKYDRFVALMAEDALESVAENSTEQFLCLFYAGEFDAAMNLLKSDAYQGSKIRRYYETAVEKTQASRRTRTYWAVNFGHWSPTGELELLGDHPMTGGSYGGKSGKYEYDLTMNLRYLNSPNYYTVIDDGYVDSTDHFFNAYIGVNGAIEFGDRGPFSWLLMAGVGAELLDTFDNPNKSDEDKAVSLWSPTAQIGLGGRYYFSQYRTWHITANVKYHLFNFDTNGGTDLSGNALSFGITIGAFAFGHMNERLRLLNHFD